MSDLNEKIIATPESQVKRKREVWGTRHTFTLMSFLGFASVHNMRVNLSVAIVGMVNSTANSNSSSEVNLDCVPDWHESESQTDGPFNWDSNTQGLVLGSFYWGYVATQIPGGLMAEKYGGKWVYGLGSLFAALFNLIGPEVAKVSTVGFMATRALQGLAEGVVFPAMYSMASKWIPAGERALLLGTMLAGGQVGVVVSMVVSGFITTHWGWEAAFYVPGGLGILWFVFWCFICFDSPEDHPRISKNERVYLMQEIPSNVTSGGKGSPAPPIMAILTSVPFWALTIVHVGHNWGFYALMTGLPTYLNNIQHFALSTNGVLSALPYLLMWITSILAGAISDRLVNSGRVSADTMRKVMNTIAHYGAAAGLVWLAFVGCSREMAVVALCLAMGLNGCAFSGFLLNHADLSPNFSGTLGGITNTFSNLCGFITPAVTGAITNGNQTIGAWRIVFLLAAAIFVAFNTVFVFFGSAKVQPWNEHGQMKYSVSASKDDQKKNIA